MVPLQGGHELQDVALLGGMAPTPFRSNPIGQALKVRRQFDEAGVLRRCRAALINCPTAKHPRQCDHVCMVEVPDLIRANRPPDDDGRAVNEALNILEAPWPRREEILLRDWFNGEELRGVEKARMLVQRIRETGLEPFNQPKVLPPIEPEEITLVCWLGLMATGERRLRLGKPTQQPHRRSCQTARSHACVVTGW